MKYRSNACFLTGLLIAACGLLVSAQAQYWTPDLTFAPVIEANTGLRGVTSKVAYPGGKLLVGSSYSIVNGINVTGRLVRLNSDGTLDPTFQNPPRTLPLRVYADGTILVSTSVDGYAPYRIKRLLVDGSVDPGFNGPNLSPSGDYTLGTVLLDDGRTLIYGDFGKVNDGTQIGLVVLKTDGTVDSAFISPLTSGNNQVILNHAAQTSDGHILIAGQFYFNGSTSPKKLARLNLTGSVDTSFNADGVQFDTMPTRLYPQGNGKTLVAHGAYKLLRLTSVGAADGTLATALEGSVSGFGPQKSNGKIFYTTLTYVNSVSSRQLRLMNPDGTDDATFPAISTPYATSYELGMPVLSDNDTYFEGPLTEDRYNLRQDISRVLANGSIDPSFNPRFARSAALDAYIRQPDGKHIVAGSFDYVNNTAMPQAYNVVRLNDNGTLDPTFSISLYQAVSVSRLFFQPGGKIVVQGDLSDQNGMHLPMMVRLNADGTHDATFHAITQSYLQTAVDGEGYIYLYTSEGIPQLRRYTPDGLSDGTFQTGALNGIVASIIPLPDGSVFVRLLSFTNYNAQSLVRLQHDGTPAPNFVGVADSNLVAVAALPDGNVFFCAQTNAPVAGGQIFTVNRIQPSGVRDYVYVSRIEFNTDMSLDIQLAIAGAAFDLLRMGTNGADAQVSIDLVQGSGTTTFNCGTDGQLFIRDKHTYWNSFQRYQRTALTSPSMDPTVSLLPFTPRNAALALNSFYFAPVPTVSGLGPFTYQWRKNGASIAGADARFFSIQSVQASDAGEYSVVISNATSSVTSPVDILTVGIPEAPVIVAPPASQAVVAGSTVTLAVTATGTPAPTYQWRKNGSNISGATGSSYTIASASAGDIGSYTVVATNSAGSVTSSAATLTIRFPFTTDFNGDGQTDILWQNIGSGDHGLWTMNGTMPSAWTSLPAIALDWRIVGTGDFNGDGMTDILWENVGSGDRGLWIMNGTVPAAWVNLPAIALNWRIVGTGDFNSDGMVDILWENVGSGDRGMWIMNGTVPVAWINLPSIALNWRIVGTGDFNGDGMTDILWENVGSGDRGLWIMNATVPAAWINLPSIALNWQIAGAGDFNSDGQTDILWENVSSGDRGLWIMNGTVPAAWINLPSLTLDWRIAR